jgi:hypothetical protein
MSVLNELADAWHSKQMAEGHALRFVRAKTRIVYRLAEFAHDNDWSENPRKITEEQMQAFVASLNLSANSRKIYMTELWRFARWANLPLPTEGGQA